MELQMIKHAGGNLSPAFEQDAIAMQKIKNGNLCHVAVTQPRNAKFLRKYFALLNFAFDYWEPEAIVINGIEAGKDFERYRKDITILAGFRYPVVNIRGEVRYEAESISFGKMTEDRFNDVYSRTFDVLWRLILSKVPQMTEQDAHNAINALQSFD